MSLLIYNGIRLDIVKVQRWHREAVYNGFDYLYHRHQLTVRAVLNPALTNYAVGGQQGVQVLQRVQNVNVLQAGPRQGGRPNPQPPAAAQGQAPLAEPTVAGQWTPAAVDDQVIRHAMLQPRRQFRYDVGPFTVLYSPLPGYVTDAANGPKPISFDVVDIQGPKTWVVDFSIEFAINECVLFRGKVSPVLSNQWWESHEIDQDFMTTKVVNGRVVFRSDVLQQLRADRNTPISQSLADNYRNLVFHPVSPTLRREQIVVKALEDGVTLDYSFRDVEQHSGLATFAIQQNVTRVEALHGRTEEFGGMEGLVDKAVREGLRGFERNPEHLGGAAAGALLGALSAAPVGQDEIIVRVWGNANATRDGLEQVAHRVFQARATLLAAFVGGYVFTVNHDLKNHFVEARYRIFRPPITTLLGNASNLLQGRPGGVFFNVAAAAGQQLPGALPGIGGVIGQIGLQQALNAANLGLQLGVNQLAGVPFVGPLFQGFGRGVGNLLAPQKGLNTFFGPNGEDSGQIVMRGGQQPGPPGDSLSRGTFLEALITQILATPCDAPDDMRAVEPPSITTPSVPTRNELR